MQCKKAVRRLARKRKVEEPSGGSSPWLATFADLMNLLLCFFVMLFAMSEVDAEKFEQLSLSLSSSFGIFDGGGHSILEGELISSGMYQLNDIGEFYNNVGQDSGKDNDTGSSSGNKGNVQEAMDQIKEEKANVSAGMYDNLSDLADQYEIADLIELNIDPDYRFVQLSLRGSVLFDSGKADIKEEAIPILSKVGDVLSKFKDYTIEIEGHTDNVPMTSGRYKNNLWLSSARALNAAEYLINNKGMDPSRLKYSGRGEYDPVASNDTQDGKAKNRRIEIKIYNELSGK